MDFVVRPVFTLPDMPADVAYDNDGRASEGYPIVDWCVVANLSVIAVHDQATGWESEAWSRRGVQCGLRGDDLFAWDDLFSRPIGVGSEGVWIDGRHRAAIIAASGADYVVMVDPRWIPRWD